MQTTDDFIEPIPKPNTSTDRLHIPSKREISTSDDGSLSSPFDIKKISLASERVTAEQPTLFPNLLRSVPTTSFSLKPPTQLPALQTDQNTSTGATKFGDPSNNSNKFNAQVIACIGNYPPPAEVENFTPKNTAYHLPTVASDGTEDDEMKSTTSLSLRADGEDDSDANFQEEEVQAASSTVPTTQGSSTRKIPLPRDTSFSTRPSRKAARNAAAVMAAARKKAKKGRGRGGGGGDSDGAGASAPPPPPTASAPPPPPPPPPRRSRGGNGPPSGGHNQTWGFTTGPGGPWIEPPVVNDAMFARPSEKKGLRKEAKEAIKQLEWSDPNYDPHSPSKVRKQETMYNLRVLANSGHQWPTSNARGALDWEEVQKRRMGVAVREAMRQQEEEDEAEEMEKLRKMRLKQKADKKRDNGEGSSQSAAGQVMNTNRDGDGAGSFTTVAASDADYIDEEKSDDDDAATLVGQQSDDDNDGDHSVHDASLDTIPRSFNDDFAQRLAALREPQRANNRVPSSIGPSDDDGNGDASDYIDTSASDKSRRYPFTFHKQLNLNHAYEQDKPKFNRYNNAPTAPQALRTPPASFLQQKNPYTHTSATNASSPAALREVASEMMNDMDTIASRNNTDINKTRRTGDDGPLRMHDFEYHNLVASGQIGGAADTREARPAPGPFVFHGGSNTSAVGGEADSSRSSSGSSSNAVNDYNARLTDLMERHLGLQLESPPPPGEPFPALTGEWPQFPAGLLGEMPGQSANSRIYGGGRTVGGRGGGSGGGAAAARRGFGPFGEDSSGSGQQRSSRRPE